MAPRFVAGWFQFDPEDVPGIVLSIVSAATVAHGAMLLRNQSKLLMLALGGGVAAATYVMDKRLIERLNTLRPQQNLLLVFVCWVPLFFVATAFAAVTAFSAIAPTLGADESKQQLRQHWTRETAKVAEYIGALRTAVQKKADVTTAEIDAEQRAAAAALVQRVAYQLDRLRQLRREATTLGALRGRVVAASMPPAEPPDDAAKALNVLGTAFQLVRALDADAQAVLDAAPTAPKYELLTVASMDLQSVLVRETLQRSAPAMMAWTTAALIELLPLVALFRGGRKIPLAVRLLECRRRLADIRDVLRGRVPLVTVPMVVEPLRVRGVLRARLLPSSTARDCMPRLEDAVAEFPRASGRVVIAGLATAEGLPVDPDEPLLRQLDGRPLTVRVEVER